MTSLSVVCFVEAAQWQGHGSRHLIFFFFYALDAHVCTVEQQKQVWLGWIGWKRSGGFEWTPRATIGALEINFSAIQSRNQLQLT